MTSFYQGPPQTHPLFNQAIQCCRELGDYGTEQQLHYGQISPDSVIQNYHNHLQMRNQSMISRHHLQVGGAVCHHSFA